MHAAVDAWCVTGTCAVVLWCALTWSYELNYSQHGDPGLIPGYSMWDC